MGGKGWLHRLAVKLNYEPFRSSSLRAGAARPIDVWGKAVLGTRWLVLGGGRWEHGHPAENPFTLLHHTRQQTGHVDCLFCPDFLLFQNLYGGGYNGVAQQYCCVKTPYQLSETYIDYVLINIRQKS